MERHPKFWMGRRNIVKMAIVPKVIYRFNTINIIIPAALFVDFDKLILKCIWKGKGPKVAKTILKKKNKAGRLTFPDVKTYYKATVIKTVQYWHED